jgi:hypothetical protein
MMDRGRVYLGGVMRRTGRLSRILGVLTLGILISAAAGAQVVSDGAENPEADAFVSRGIAMRAQGKDAEALTLFEKAAELDPGSVRVQIHLATVHQALGHWLLADDYLRSALEHQNHPYINRHRQSLDDARRVIEANIGRFAVEGEPAGAEVRLNGRLVGTLPLTTPVRATVGSYTLDVRLKGHYPSQRPIIITGGTLVRETVQLERLPEKPGGVAESGPERGSTTVGGDARLDDPASRGWLTWTLVGASGVAAGTTLGALIFREVHAARWNDDARCLEVERTRAEVCGGERDKVSSAEDIAVVGGVLTGMFAVGALVNVFAFQANEPGRAGLGSCGIGWGRALCVGSF